MRYARNLADGFGLVWNPSGERIEGYTNFLWTIYMALVHLFPVPNSKTSLVILLTNIMLAAAVIPIMIRLIRVLKGGTLVAVAALTAYVLNRNVMVWATAGFETTLLTLLFLLATLRVVKEAQEERPSLSTFMLIAVMSLVRADAAVLSALLYAIAMALNKNRKLVASYAALSLVVPIAHEIFRLSYYGDILPNTAYLKTSNWDGKIMAGLQYVLDFAKHYPFVLGFAFAGTLLSRQRLRLYLLAAVAAYMAYVAYVGGDAFPGFRFFVPILPLLLVLAFLGIESLELARPIHYLRSILQRQSITRRVLLVGGITMIGLALAADFIGVGAQPGLGPKQILGIVIGFGLLIGSFTVQFWQGALERILQHTILPKLVLGLLCIVVTPLVISGYRRFLVPRRADMGNVKIGLLLQQNTPPETKVADFWAGSVFYFSERYAIDLLGKSDRYIAHLPAVSDGTKPGHNKFDFDYSLGVLKPDVVIANFKLPVEEDRMLKMSTGNWAFTGQLYFNQIFQEHCLPYPVAVDTWRTIFVCDWSSHVDYRDSWHELVPR